MFFTTATKKYNKRNVKPPHWNLQTSNFYEAVSKINEASEI
jgi:hypothetical protein